MLDIAKTVEHLLKAKDAYYNSGNPIMSDEEFDALELALRDVDPTNAYFLEVGSEVRGEKVKLPVPMGSLDQAYDNGVAEWIDSIGFYTKSFVITDKLDGLSCLLIYDNDGLLKIAYSRGDGFYGHDITRHIKRFKNLPQKISQSMMIRAEVIFSEDKFHQLNTNGKLGRVFKNARNYVAGQMNRKEADEVFYQHADIVCYEVKTGHLSKTEQLKSLSSEGFIIPGYEVVQGNEINYTVLMERLADRKQNSAYWLDGLVIDVNDRADILSLGDRQSSSLNPTYAKKFKINSESNSAEAEVVAVHWNVSKVGYLKPRVQIQPVELVGVTVTFATGFNAKFIVDNGIGPGAKIRITRSGDVIPYIQEVLKKVAPAYPDTEEFGEWGKDFSWNDTGVDLVLNDDHEDAQFKRLCEFFAGIEVPALRAGNMERLIQSGFDTMEKIILASEDDLKKSIGDAIGSKIYAGIKEKLNPIPLWKLAGASQIFGRGIGSRKMKKLWEVRQNFLDMTYREVLAVEGFSDISANAVITNMPRFVNFLNSIEGYYSLEGKQAPSSKKFADVNVCFTGIRDKELEEKIIANGGTIASGVNAKTTHLVAKDPSSNSGKLKKAAELNIKVIGIDEARSIWG